MEITWNKLCVDLIWHYVIRKKGHKDSLNLRAVTMINYITGWFKITQYNDKREILIVNLFETKWLSRYPRPM